MKIKEYAAAIVAEIACECVGPDEILSRIDEQASERINDTAGNICTYYHQALEMIDRLEGHYSFDVDEDATYAAHQWREAAQAYGIGLTTAALYDELERLVSELEDSLETFTDEAKRIGWDGQGEASLSNSCEYGWAAHNYETADGVMVWNKDPGGCFPALLEGEMVAISHQLIEGVWANLAWTPAS